MERPFLDHPFRNSAALSSGALPAAASQDRQDQTPFVAETRRRGVSQSGSFVPSARLVLTSALRTEGLWHALPGEEIKTLVLLLTFLTPDGACRPALAELAPAMRLAEPKARARLERLAAYRWQGNPVIRELRRDSGLHAFTPAPGLLTVLEMPPEVPEPPAGLGVPAGREAVVAHSRALYARPRAEVEREMALRMGWEDGDALRQAREREEAALTDDGRDLLTRLLGLGVERAKALELLGAHEPERICRQVEWLPLRGAKNPARFLVAAIAGNYEPPAGLRPVPARQGLQGEAPTKDGEPAGWDAIDLLTERSGARETQPPGESPEEEESRAAKNGPGREDLPAPRLEGLPDVEGRPDPKLSDLQVADPGQPLTLPAFDPFASERHTS